MSEALHRGARTTSLIRKEIQQSTAMLKTLAKKCNINPNTVFKWKHCVSFDKKTGLPSWKKPTLQQETIAITLQKHTQLSIKECYYTPKALIPDLHRI